MLLIFRESGMRTRKSLNGESLLQLIYDLFAGNYWFKKVPDHRDQSRITFSLEDILMSGFAIFGWQRQSWSILSFREGDWQGQVIELG